MLRRLSRFVRRLPLLCPRMKRNTMALESPGHPLRAISPCGHEPVVPHRPARPSPPKANPAPGLGQPPIIATPNAAASHTYPHHLASNNNSNGSKKKKKTPRTPYLAQPPRPPLHPPPQKAPSKAASSAAPHASELAEPAATEPATMKTMMTTTSPPSSRSIRRGLVLLRAQLAAAAGKTLVPPCAGTCAVLPGGGGEEAMTRVTSHRRRTHRSGRRLLSRGGRGRQVEEGVRRLGVGSGGCLVGNGVSRAAFAEEDG